MSKIDKIVIDIEANTNEVAKKARIIAKHMLGLANELEEQKSVGLEDELRKEMYNSERWKEFKIKKELARINDMYAKGFITIVESGKMRYEVLNKEALEKEEKQTHIYKIAGINLYSEYKDDKGNVIIVGQVDPDDRLLDKYMVYFTINKSDYVHKLGRKAFLKKYTLVSDIIEEQNKELTYTQEDVDKYKEQEYNNGRVKGFEAAKKMYRKDSRYDWFKANPQLIDEYLQQPPKYLKAALEECADEIRNNMKKHINKSLKKEEVKIVEGIHIGGTYKRYDGKTVVVTAVVNDNIGRSLVHFAVIREMTVIRFLEEYTLVGDTFKEETTTINKDTESIIVKLKTMVKPEEAEAEANRISKRLGIKCVVVNPNVDEIIQIKTKPDYTKTNQFLGRF